jgi:hypothetical protein
LRISVVAGMTSLPARLRHEVVLVFWTEKGAFLR